MRKAVKFLSVQAQELVINHVIDGSGAPRGAPEHGYHRLASSVETGQKAYLGPMGPASSGPDGYLK